VLTAVPPEASSQSSEEDQQAVEKEQLTSAYTNLQYFNSVLSPIPGVSCLPAAGRLLQCLQNWQEITANQWILQVVRGYKLKLLAIPAQKLLPQTLGAKNHHLIREEVQKLIAKGAVRRVTPCADQFLSQIFLVPKKDVSYRPVVNLRPLNQFMQQVHFKMENLGMMRDLLREDDWLA